MIVSKLASIALGVSIGVAAGLATPAQAQLHNPCPDTNDGDCDEPNGLGFCAWGTDAADCANPNSNFGGGSGFIPGGGQPSGGGLQTFSPWSIHSNDLGTHSAQHGQVTPLAVHGGHHFQVGTYHIYTGIAAGPFGPISNVARYSVTLRSEEQYAARATSQSQVSFGTDARLIRYSRPDRNHAMIYARNDDMQTPWRAICVLPAGWPMATCGPTQ